MPSTNDIRKQSMRRKAALPRRFARRGQKLSTPGGAVATFPYPIEQLLDCGSAAVVLLDAPADISRNVYGVDRDGRILWRLPKSPLDGKGRELEDPYIKIEQRARTVRVFSRRDQVYDADPRSGIQRTADYFKSKKYFPVRTYILDVSGRPRK